MGQLIDIKVGDILLRARLNESQTAEVVYAALPIHTTANRWGDEFYFSIPVKEKQSADARSKMEVGELAYWAPGEAFCIFFGPTPMSEGNEPRAASPVNPIGRIVDDVEPLKSIPDGATVTIEKSA